MNGNSLLVLDLLDDVEAQFLGDSLSGFGIDFGVLEDFALQQIVQEALYGGALPLFDPIVVDDMAGATPEILMLLELLSMPLAQEGLVDDLVLEFEEITFSVDPEGVVTIVVSSVAVDLLDFTVVETTLVVTTD